MLHSTHSVLNMQFHIWMAVMQICFKRLANHLNEQYSKLEWWWCFDFVEYYSHKYLNYANIQQTLQHYMPAIFIQILCAKIDCYFTLTSKWHACSFHLNGECAFWDILSRVFHSFSLSVFVYKLKLWLKFIVVSAKINVQLFKLNVDLAMRSIQINGELHNCFPQCPCACCFFWIPFNLFGNWNWYHRFKRAWINKKTSVFKQ